jgi:PAS domain S-box-containing protein
LADDVMKGVRPKLEAARVPHRSAVLFPLVRKDEVVGAMFLRSTERQPHVSAEVLSTGRLIASLAALALGNALEQDMLRREQRALSRAKERTDRQLEGLRQFSEFFEQSHDGIVVTDKEGAIRYANAAAGKILGRDPTALKGARFAGLLAQRSLVLAERAWRGDRVGDGYGYVDLLVPRTGDQDAVISAAIRPMADPDGVLVSFRDVTELREIENELRQTKEFLENLIQSSVDAIVAADIDGRIILFNRAAEELFGYAARDAVGRLRLADLYPKNEADDVMRRLRGEGYGGRGRLEIIRKEALAKSGELVPVNLTAAIIYEDDREAASVSIFRDLRERVRMEEKLSQVQSKLQMTERQSVAIELAGAAAHELNQPLTSILGYAEMLKTRIPPEDRNRKPIEVICRETERMAGIVRRIGQITAYKTQAYVGGSQILDLTTPTQPKSRRDTSPGGKNEE